MIHDHSCALEEESLFLAIRLNLVSSGWHICSSVLVEQQQRKEEILQGFA